MEGLLLFSWLFGYLGVYWSRRFDNLIIDTEVAFVVCQSWHVEDCSEYVRPSC